MNRLMMWLRYLKYQIMDTRTRIESKEGTQPRLIEQVKIVKKGTPEFAEARKRYLALFGKDQPESTIVQGMAYMKTTQIDKLKEIPMPFGCLLLELCTWPPNPDGSQSVAYFCGRGPLCTCCREDFTKPEEEYPAYCPSSDFDEPSREEAFEDDLGDNDFDDDEEAPDF